MKSKKSFKSFDILGNIAVVKFPKATKLKEKKQFAEKILRSHKSVTTILEKTGKFKGRLRKQSTKHIAGVKTKEVLYCENNCVFRFNIDKVYFSPRLSNERKEIAQKVRKGDEVLVMFAGAGPYSIVIAKNSRAGKVYSNEINREANKYAVLNAELNKVKDKIVFLYGDIKKIVKRLKKVHPSRPLKNFNVKNIALKNVPVKFDVIVMPRPQLKETFLREAFALSKRGTRIFYYDFAIEDEIKNVVNKIKKAAEKYRKKIKILKIKKAGEIAPYKFRIRVDFKVLN